MEVERRSNVFLSGQGYRAIWSPDEINMIAQDDPRHRQQRMLVQHKFTCAEVANRRPDPRPSRPTRGARGRVGGR